MNLCINCKRFTSLGFCVAPQNGISPVHGQPKPLFATASRGEGVDKCGPDGVWFVMKEVKVKQPWWRFWG